MDLNPEEIWKRALADAPDVPTERLHRVAIAGGPDAEGSRYAFHIPPTSSSVDVFATVTGDERRQLDSYSGHRVAHVSEVDEMALLGLLRSQLEFVRQWEHKQAVYDLTWAINASLDGIYSGPGSAVVDVSIPAVRDSNAAGALLIRKMWGQQFARYQDPHFGQMFRTDRAPLPLEDLPRRQVVFAALHAEAFDEFRQRTGMDWLSGADEHGPEWWEALKADELFTHLRKSAPAFRPSEGEVEALKLAPAQAWRPLESLLDRAHDRGLEVIASI